jgi:hypothetical protein
VPDIESIQAEIRARQAELQELIEPLEAEVEQLRRLAATFADAPGSKPASGGARRRPRPAGRRRDDAAPVGRPPRGGRRAQEAVAKILEQPGITVAELARAMGIRPNYLYRVLPRLEEEAKVIRRGKGYHPAGDAGPTAAGNGQPDKS